MTTGELRETFLLEQLFTPGDLTLVYCDVDRAIVGSAVPVGTPLELGTADRLRAAYFAERREVGILNVGATGDITVDGTTFRLDHKDGLYIGRGSRSIRFSSADPAAPAAFYILSYPAHANYPTALARRAGAQPVHLGSAEGSNKRTIWKTIHPEGIRSCQLVMGYTELEPGSVWNTMPPHTHERRMEVYLYFDMAENTRVFHLMGRPEETRHIIVAGRQAVFSPSWSIHSGVGTGPYTFCWGMGGENQTFDDMDGLSMNDLH
jgi:4-deoxy-L-threo-5-hexosulose-uronate ketol-isomerase